MIKKISILLLTLFSIIAISVGSNKASALVIYENESSVVIDSDGLNFLWQTDDYTLYWLVSEKIPFLANAEETTLTLYNLAVGTNIFISFFEYQDQATATMTFEFNLVNNKITINHAAMILEAQQMYTMNSINHFTITFFNDIFTETFHQTYLDPMEYLYSTVGASMNLKLHLFSEAWSIKIIYLDYRGNTFYEEWVYTNDITPPITYPSKEGGYYNYVATDWKFLGWFSEIANEYVYWDSLDTLKEFVEKHAPYDEASGTWNNEIVFEPRYLYVGSGNLDYTDPTHSVPSNVFNILGLFNLDSNVGFMLLYIIIAFTLLLGGTAMKLDIVIIAIVQGLVLAIFLYFGMLKTWTTIILVLAILLSLLWGLKRRTTYE